MRAFVVFESMFGNTQAIAEAIADGLSSCMETDIAEVSEAPTAIDDGVALLVVGGPTHAFGMSRPGTRRSAAEQTEEALVSTGRGLREWLDALDGDVGDTASATFDTHADRPRLPGSAARSAQKRLRRLGFATAAKAESFYVGGMTGPLLDGETERARRWGAALGSAVVASTGRPVT